MDLKPIRFPWKNLFDRQMFEGRAAGVAGLWQRCLLHLLIVLEALGYTCCRRHDIDQRRLIQPGNSVWRLRLSKIHQQRPGSPARLGRVDLESAFGWSHSLSKQLVLSSWDLPLGTFVIFLILISSCPWLCLQCSALQKSWPAKHLWCRILMRKTLWWEIGKV